MQTNSGDDDKARCVNKPSPLASEQVAYEPVLYAKRWFLVVSIGRSTMVSTKVNDGREQAA